MWWPNPKKMSFKFEYTFSADDEIFDKIWGNFEKKSATMQNGNSPKGVNGTERYADFSGGRIAFSREENFKRLFNWAPFGRPEFFKAYSWILKCVSRSFEDFSLLKSRGLFTLKDTLLFLLTSFWSESQRWAEALEVPTRDFLSDFRWSFEGFDFHHWPNNSHWHGQTRSKSLHSWKIWVGEYAGNNVVVNSNIWESKFWY